MTRLRTLLPRLRVLVVMAASAAAQAQSQSSPTRGELLYTTHCVACHSTQMHWREQIGRASCRERVYSSV